MAKERVRESARGDQHAEKYATGIFAEQACADNPYVAAGMRCFGYDQLELVENLDFASYLYLLLRGCLPTPEQSALLNRALIAFSNPGVRHPATRAAVTAGVGKTVASSVLPVGLMLMSSEEDGADSIVGAMKALRRAAGTTPGQGKMDSARVFGLDSGSENRWLDELCRSLAGGQDFLHLCWGQAFIDAQRSAGVRVGWLRTGLVAATFADLGIRPALAPGLLQMLAAPGLLVQGMENAHREPGVLPFIDDASCEIDR